MSKISTHKSQAEHNEKLAISLKESEYFDWSIIAAFYSALHYVEAKFGSTPGILHGEDAYNKNLDNAKENNLNSLHAFREWLVSKTFTSKIYACYRHLRTNSETARYLENTHDKTAYEYFDKETTEKLLTDLDTLKNELS